MRLNNVSQGELKLGQRIGEVLFDLVFLLLKEFELVLPKRAIAVIVGYYFIIVLLQLQVQKLIVLDLQGRFLLFFRVVLGHGLYLKGETRSFAFQLA